ncbi:MAG: DUF4349 domain-containing protein [Desulfobacterales bacterium]|nr:DUF4349 domain-containing protein [Desulfobacterales bacterium]MCP4161445.1 DUF4349 domain-containing protein [Deltaproteobacteria bacterium]
MIYYLRLFFIIIILIPSISCSNNEKSFEQAPREQKTLINENKKTNLKSRKLIKEGHITFKCSDMTRTKVKIKEIIKSKEGYIANENEYSSRNKVELRYIIRAPSKQFDSLVMEISNLADKLDNKSIYVKDVTEEYMDVETRIKIDKEVEDKYRKLLKRARNVNEILAIESNIGKIREEIEIQEGRLKYLKNQIGLSTLNVRVYKTTSMPRGFWNDVKSGFADGWDMFLLFLIGLVNIWPFLILLPLVIYGFVIMRRKRKSITNNS